jgi:hypothetical protein
MEGYWWACDKKECRSLQAQLPFRDTVGVGIVGFLWDELSGTWDQNLLAKNCGACGGRSLRITYDFPRAEPERVRVTHIVGLRREKDPFMQMIWEGVPDNYPDQGWFDFKYMYGRNNLGLKRPAIFTREQLRELFTLYREKTGKHQFP